MVLPLTLTSPFSTVGTLVASCGSQQSEILGFLGTSATALPRSNPSIAGPTSATACVMLSVMPAASRVSGSCQDATVTVPPDLGLPLVVVVVPPAHAASSTPPTPPSDSNLSHRRLPVMHSSFLQLFLIANGWRAYRDLPAFSASEFYVRPPALSTKGGLL